MVNTGIAACMVVVGTYPLSRLTWVSRLPDLSRPIPVSTGSINLFHLALSASSYLHVPSSFKSLLITSIKVIFGLPLQLGPLTLGYSIHLLVKSLSGFLCTSPNHLSLFHCSTMLMLSIPSLSLSSADGTQAFTIHPSYHPHFSLFCLVPSLLAMFHFHVVCYSSLHYCTLSHT